MCRGVLGGAVLCQAVACRAVVRAGVVYGVVVCGVVVCAAVLYGGVVYGAVVYGAVVCAAVLFGGGLQTFARRARHPNQCSGHASQCFTPKHDSLEPRNPQTAKTVCYSDAPPSGPGPVKLLHGSAMLEVAVSSLRAIVDLHGTELQHGGGGAEIALLRPRVCLVSTSQRP